MSDRFVARGIDKVWLYEKPDTGAKRVDLRWGDYLNVESQDDTWTKVRWGKKSRWVLTENVAKTRPVEVIFVDVGQGDGCLFVSAETGKEERIMVIDAGVGTNMFRFLNWRFGKFKKRFDFHAAIITHPDSDHYRGFGSLFNNRNVYFDHVYHNGIMEYARGPALGPSDGRLLTGLMLDDQTMRTHLSVDENIVSESGKSKAFPKMLKGAMESNRVRDFSMVSTEHGEKNGDGKCWLPGFSPDSGRSASLRVLGPVVEAASDGSAGLRWFGDNIESRARNVGKTKNGHSVLLKMEVGNLSLLFGGDLNSPAEDFLLRHYSKKSDGPLTETVAGASKIFGCDIMKCCHHGSADVTDEFLRAVSPFAFVVSSGDEESHAHPRPDLLGRLGKQGRGDAPLILCTEILRSTREKGVSADFVQLRKLDKAIDERPEAATLRNLQRKRREIQKRIERRNVGVYGAITLRTDGDHMEVSFMLEKPRTHRDATTRWQRYHFEYVDGKGWVGELGEH